MTRRVARKRLPSRTADGCGCCHPICARTLNGARLAVAAPWLVLLAMSAQPDVITRYRSSAGVLVLAVGAVVCVGAYRLMMRIGRLPTERRILS